MSTLKVAAINNASAGSGGLAISSTGNVTGAGMDLITSQTFTTASTVSINNCFSSTYENYRIVLTSTQSANCTMQIRVRTSGADVTAANYFNMGVAGSNAGTTQVYGASSQAAGQMWTAAAGDRYRVGFDVFDPMTTSETMLSGNIVAQLNGGTVIGGSFGVAYFAAGTHDGFSVYPSTGTFTGVVRVYGYRN